MRASRVLFVPFGILLGLTACPKDDTDTQATWQLTCGDPVCNTHTDHGVLACTSEVAGAICTTEGAACDPGNDCNADLRCSVEDPAVECPISLRSAKRDVRYLAPDEVAAVAADLAKVKLATWRYNDEPEGSKLHMGFLIDDLPAQSPAVRADGGHVDLYGYASMNAAAAQEQERRITALERELADLKAELARR